VASGPINKGFLAVAKASKQPSAAALHLDADNFRFHLLQTSHLQAVCGRICRTNPGEQGHSSDLLAAAVKQLHKNV